MSSISIPCRMSLLFFSSCHGHEVFTSLLTADMNTCGVASCTLTKHELEDQGIQSRILCSVALQSDTCARVRETSVA
jgi:hypothetical protein